MNEGHVFRLTLAVLTEADDNKDRLFDRMILQLTGDNVVILDHKMGFKSCI